MAWGEDKQSADKCIEQKSGITSFFVEKYEMLLVDICGNLVITECVGQSHVRS